MTDIRDEVAAVLDRIRDETRAAVLEGNAEDCTSADCIADAVWEICRVALRGLTVVREGESDLERITAVCDLLWDFGVYMADSTPLAEAIVARLTRQAEAADPRVERLEAALRTGTRR